MNHRSIHRNPKVQAYNAMKLAESAACVGEVFGCLTVVGVDRVEPKFGTFVHVVCGCGEPDSRRLSTLRHGSAPKMGCRACRHLRTALRMYPVRGLDARALHERALRARGSYRP